MQHLDFLGRGIKFPFRFSDRTGAPAESLDLDRINASIIQILETRPGERFMRPDFGSHVKNLVFEQNNAIVRGLLRLHIMDAIQKWEKRVAVVDVSFDESPATTNQNVLLVRISYRVIQSQVEGNLVFPFYRET